MSARTVRQALPFLIPRTATVRKQGRLTLPDVASTPATCPLGPPPLPQVRGVIRVGAGGAAFSVQVPLGPQRVGDRAEAAKKRRALHAGAKAQLTLPPPLDKRPTHTPLAHFAMHLALVGTHKHYTARAPSHGQNTHRPTYTPPMSTPPAAKFTTTVTVLVVLTPTMSMTGPMPSGSREKS
jgi:hypothetical protein